MLQEQRLKFRELKVDPSISRSVASRLPTGAFATSAGRGADEAREAQGEAHLFVSSERIARNSSSAANSQDSRLTVGPRWPEYLLLRSGP
jgi:hypothetical protein